ncbi:MAG: energy transducer TonB [Rhodocyclaceae bacterium]|nr:energy transducer TonB [Rhodocyclaceae bacterium]
MRPAYRLLLALATSILLHLALMAVQPFTPAPVKPARLDVRLVIPASVPEEPPPVVSPADPDILLKNTIATNSETPAIKPPPDPNLKPGRLKVAQEEKASRRESKYDFYTPAAREAGLEGTVTLFLKLDAKGTILHVSVAATSGHPELDHAAVQGLLRAGRYDSGGQTEKLVPFTFRLQ